MERSQIILAAMAASGTNIRFDPVRIQKLLFLIEQEATPHIDGPHFNFRPYRYGPFDRAVFQELGALQGSGKVKTQESHRRAYWLTDEGQESGAAVLSSLPGAVREYFEECARWVFSLSFGNLLSAIYQKYPEMAVNSVVPEVGARYPLALSRSPMPSFLVAVARTLDLGGVLDEYNFGPSSNRDAEALHNAWRTVGNNLRTAMKGCKKLPAGADAS